jgi:hypothetical protein
VTERRSRSSILVWGRAPQAGSLAIESVRGRRVRRLRSLTVQPRQVFALRLNLKGERTLRATVDGESSLPWTVGGR